MDAIVARNTQILSDIEKHEYRSAACCLLEVAEELSKAKNDPNITDRLAELAIQLHQMSSNEPGSVSPSDELKSIYAKIKILDTKFIFSRKWFSGIFEKVNMVTKHPPGAFLRPDSNETRFNRISGNYTNNYIFHELVNDIEAHCQFVFDLSLNWSFINGLCYIKTGKLHDYAKARFELFDGYKTHIQDINQVLTEANALLIKLRELEICSYRANEEISEIKSKIRHLISIATSRSLSAD